MTRPHCQQPDACRATGRGHCGKCAAAMRWSDPEMRERHRKAVKEAWQVPGRRERHSERQREISKDPEYRAKHRAAMQAREHRERKAETTKAHWQDREYRARNIEGRRAKAIACLGERARQEYAAARAEGFKHRDALEIARDAEKQAGAA